MRIPGEKGSIWLPATIVAATILLHWGVARIASGGMLLALNAAITALAVFLIWRSFQLQRAERPGGAHPATGKSGVALVLLQSHSGFSSHFAGSSEDLAQIQALLGDAIGKLLKSFDGMHRLIQEQLDAAVAAAGQGEASIEDSLDETSQTLKQLVDGIADNSRIGLALAGQMESISRQVDAILPALGEMDAISGQISRLSLDAAIEPARAGESGPGFAAAADEVSRLSARAEQFSRQIRANIGAVHVGIKDVERSIERMAALDMGFTLNSKNHLDGIMARVQQSGRDMARAIERQAEITGKVNEVVGSAVTSLQFQDIVGQLVRHTQLRLGSMQEAWRVIGELAQREPDGKPVPPGEVEAVCGKIAGIFHDADALSLRNPVQQDQMQTGDVDLF